MRAISASAFRSAAFAFATAASSGAIVSSSASGCPTSTRSPSSTRSLASTTDGRDGPAIFKTPSFGSRRPSAVTARGPWGSVDVAFAGASGARHPPSATASPMSVPQTLGPRTCTLETSWFL